MCPPVAPLPSEEILAASKPQTPEEVVIVADTHLDNNDPQSALTLLLAIRPQIESCSDTKAHFAGRYYELLGLAANRCGQQLESERAFAKGLAATDLGESPSAKLIAQRFSLWTNLATVYFQDTSSANCLTIIARALDEAEHQQITNCSGLRRLWNLKGLLQERLGDNAAAADSLTRVETLFRRAPLDPLRVQNLHKLAALRFNTEHPDQAAEALQEAIDHAAQLRMPAEVAVELRVDLSLALATDLRLPKAEKEALCVLQDPVAKDSTDVSTFVTPRAVHAISRAAVGQIDAADGIMQQVYQFADMVEGGLERAIGVMKSVYDTATFRKETRLAAALVKLADRFPD